MLTLSPPPKGAVTLWPPPPSPPRIVYDPLPPGGSRIHPSRLRPISRLPAGGTKGLFCVPVACQDVILHKEPNSLPLLMFAVSTGLRASGCPDTCCSWAGSGFRGQNMGRGPQVWYAWDALQPSRQVAWSTGVCHTWPGPWAPAWPLKVLELPPAPSS